LFKSSYVSSYFSSSAIACWRSSLP
jgi:hypothetical protein